MLHAWGSKERPGFYSMLRDRAGESSVVQSKPTGTFPERLAAACKRLLEGQAIAPYFDAVLIDEGQDLAVGEEFSYDEKQAIYWLAWESLRPVDERRSQLRRLVWCYDEAQSLDTFEIPSYGEVFGEALGLELSGARSGPIYPGGVKKSEVMRRCYRTPGTILTAAHAIGMGLMRKAGALSCPTTKQDWEGLGYEVIGGEFRSGRRVGIYRPPEHSPNPMSSLWPEPLVQFEVFANHEEQMDALVEKVRRAIERDHLRPAHEMLIVVLGAGVESAHWGLVKRVVGTLKRNGIEAMMPEGDRFWLDGAVTVSGIYRAKGHEAPMVFVLGAEMLAQDEGNLSLRNQLFVAMSRASAWVHLSGIRCPHSDAEYLFYDEIREAIAAGDTFEFVFRQLPKRVLGDRLA